MAAPGYVAEDSIPDLGRQHGRPLNPAQFVLSAETIRAQNLHIFFETYKKAFFCIAKLNN